MSRIVIAVLIYLPHKPIDLVSLYLQVCACCNSALTTNKLKSGYYFILATMGKCKEKTSRQDEERDGRTCFVRKFYITETPGNFFLEVRFTAKNVSRNVYE
jgi:hypothetical protein